MTPIAGGAIKIGAQQVAVKPFWIATTEATWEAFDAFTASGPASKPYDQTAFGPDAVARPSKSYILPDLGWGHHGYPAINLTFTSVEMFCRWLSKETGRKYRVPTEAEWELACRAGLKNGQVDKAQAAKMAWLKANSGGMTHPVAKKVADLNGLYDMLGNAGEWATDLSGKPVLCGSAFDDAAASPTARRRWQPSWQETDPQIPKSRWWLADAPFAGFRIVCEP